MVSGCVERRRRPWSDHHRHARQRLLTLLRVGAAARQSGPARSLRAQCCALREGRKTLDHDRARAQGTAPVAGATRHRPEPPDLGRYGADHRGQRDHRTHPLAGARTDSGDPGRRQHARVHARSGGTSCLVADRAHLARRGRSGKTGVALERTRLSRLQSRRGAARRRLPVLGLVARQYAVGHHHALRRDRASRDRRRLSAALQCLGRGG